MPEAAHPQSAKLNEAVVVPPGGMRRVDLGTYRLAGRKPEFTVHYQPAAERLGISRTKIYTLIRRGEIRSVKIDGLRRISTTALAEYVAELERRVDAA